MSLNWENESPSEQADRLLRENTRSIQHRTQFRRIVDDLTVSPKERQGSCPKCSEMSRSLLQMSKDLECSEAAVERLQERLEGRDNWRVARLCMDVVAYTFAVYAAATLWPDIAARWAAYWR